MQLSFLKQPKIKSVEIVNVDNDKKFTLQIESQNNPSDYSRFKLTSRFVHCFGKNDELIKSINIKYLYSVGYEYAKK